MLPVLEYTETGWEPPQLQIPELDEHDDTATVLDDTERGGRRCWESETTILASWDEHE